jgi:hypothetical protein
MFPHNLETTMAAVRERQQALLEEAEKERLLASLRFQDAGRPAPTRRVAAWTGTRLVRWGMALQEYGTPTAQEVCSER